ncbi:MAG: alpha/beta hydrolase, partial [Candidatus Hydrogenedentes bacterium]|nr:alpha/beta hydrolase [Candidatus Hydrogenedentota bacterium]
LSLDIFVPKDANTPRPLLLFIHGGGWSKGKKEDYLFYNIKFAKLGYVTASVRYRLTPDHVFPANVQDVKCAIAFLREHASKYQIDSGKVVTIGGSAGGHLSLMAGYVQDPALDCPGNDGGADTSVQAVVNIYGVVDCTTPVAIAAHQVQDYIGKPYEEAKKRTRTRPPFITSIRVIRLPLPSMAPATNWFRSVRRTRFMQSSMSSALTIITIASRAGLTRWMWPSPSMAVAATLSNDSWRSTFLSRNDSSSRL